LASRDGHKPIKPNLSEDHESHGTHHHHGLILPARRCS
jgi:hypothetical protein